jgi:hypothetical protein
MAVLLMILGLVCFIAAALGAAVSGRLGRTNLVALGLAFWVAAQIVAAVPQFRRDYFPDRAPRERAPAGECVNGRIAGTDTPCH